MTLASDPTHHKRGAPRHIRGFWEHGISPRYLTPGDLEGGAPPDVTVLAFPCNVWVAEETAAARVEFVRRGGVSFSEGRFGSLNRDGDVYPHVPGARGEPSLVGMSNYRHEPSRVELRAPFDAEGGVVLDGCDGASSSAGERGGVWRVDIPARETVALVFGAPS